jgi:hypothetical protein
MECCTKSLGCMVGLSCVIECRLQAVQLGKHWSHGTAKFYWQPCWVRLKRVNFVYINNLFSSPRFLQPEPMWCQYPTTENFMYLGATAFKSFSCIFVWPMGSSNTFILAKEWFDNFNFTKSSWRKKVLETATEQQAPFRTIKEPKK